MCVGIRVLGEKKEVNDDEPRLPPRLSAQVYSAFTRERVRTEEATTLHRARNLDGAFTLLVGSTTIEWLTPDTLRDALRELSGYHTVGVITHEQAVRSPPSRIKKRGQDTFFFDQKRARLHRDGARKKYTSLSYGE